MKRNARYMSRVAIAAVAFVSLGGFPLGGPAVADLPAGPMPVASHVGVDPVPESSGWAGPDGAGRMGPT